MTSIGSNISNLRKAKHLTQSELADKLGISPQAISKWENDAAYPDITLLEPLAKILNVSIDTLLGKDNKSETSYVPNNPQKSLDDLIFKIRIIDGKNKVNVNLPLSLLSVLKDTNGLISVRGDDNTADILSKIDFDQLVALAERGVLGKLVEIEGEDGETVEIFVE